MTLLTKQQIEALLDGTTPGPWEKMLGTHGRNKICATYPCINGLSALFTIADVNVPEESERGYTDDAFNPDVAAANTGLIAAASDLARTAIDALARLEDAEAAQALVVEQAADSLLECSVWCDSQERTDASWHNGVIDARKHHMARIRALADPSGVEALAALRAERDRINQWRETAIVERDTYSEERDDALARLAAAEAQVTALRLQLDQKDALYDSGFQAGVKLGWNFGVSGDEAGFQAATASTDHVAELKRIRAALATVTPPADTGEGA